MKFHHMLNQRGSSGQAEVRQPAAGPHLCWCCCWWCSVCPRANRW
jgi:hypothetical protein